jgi:hypothetical protein
MSKLGVFLDALKYNSYSMPTNLLFSFYEAFHALNKLVIQKKEPFFLVCKILIGVKSKHKVVQVST